MRSITSYVSIYFTKLIKTIINVFEYRFKYNIFKFVLTIAIWAKIKKITKLDYVFFFEVLKLSNIFELKNFSQELLILLL